MTMHVEKKVVLLINVFHSKAILTHRKKGQTSREAAPSISNNTLRTSHPDLYFTVITLVGTKISRSVSEQLRTYLPPTLTTNNGQQVGQGKGRFAVPRHWHWSKFNKELNKFYWDYMYMVITRRGILRRDENFHGDLSCKAAFSPQIVT